MKHQIDPKIDCVFKALLGAEDNRNLLVHFLNAILSTDLATPIATVDILNPYNDKEFVEDKLSIVDVKARDNEGNLYQIEIQLVNFTDLPERILYNWADIYSEQLRNGEGYYRLKPTYSIWLLAENLIKADSDYIHTYKLRDTKGRVLNNHCGIWLLELQKFCEPQVVNEQQRWLRFFKEGAELNDDSGLPDWMTTQEMRQAMKTLKQFSEKDRDYHAYQARQNFLREQLSRQHELDEERQAKNEAIQREQAALKDKADAIKDKADAIKEIERLKALLAKNNLN
jgi:predicted transposase/invertase (TIGR01784 family)